MPGCVTMSTVQLHSGVSHWRTGTNYKVVNASMSHIHTCRVNPRLPPQEVIIPVCAVLRDVTVQKLSVTAWLYY